MGAKLCKSAANQKETCEGKISIINKSTTKTQNIIVDNMEMDQESMYDYDESGRPSITLNSATFATPNSTNYNHESCDINTCLMIKQILKILTYQLQMDGNTADLSQFIETNYCLVAILNNFHHILQKHNQSQFELLYNYFINNLFPNSQIYNFCDIQKCSSMHRLYSKSSQNVNDNHHILTIQIIDIIHCYLLHSFDTGYKLCGMDNLRENEIQNTKYDILHIQKAKKNKYKPYQWNNPRFLTKLHEKYENMDYDMIFPTFCYWDYRKVTDEKWYVCEKYDNLKQEVFAHDISRNEWDLLYTKANIYIATDNMLSMKSKHQTISVNHIICILLYCNYADFYNGFIDSFCRKCLHENDNDFKQRHSLYVNTSRFLREMINCFGPAPYSHHYHYHAVNFNLLITQNMIGQFVSNSPISTTPHFEVMALCLEYDTDATILQLDFNAVNKYFDCSFLSKYPNECQQILLIGNGGNVKYNGMINGFNGYDYKLYITAINVIFCILNGQKYVEYNPNMMDIQRIIDKLLTDQEKIPNIICKLFEKYCQNITNVNIDFNKMNKIEIECFIHSESDNFIQLYKFDEIFPNLSEITIFGNEEIRNERVALLPYLINDLIDDLQEIDNKLQKIIIINPKEKRMAILNTLETYKHKFNDIGWNISVKRKTEKHNNVCVPRNILTLIKNVKSY